MIPLLSEKPAYSLSQHAFGDFAISQVAQLMNLSNDNSKVRFIISIHHDTTLSPKIIVRSQS